MSASLASYKAQVNPRTSERTSRSCNLETHIPNSAVGVMLSLLPTVHEYSHPTRVNKYGWGFSIIHHAGPLPSKNRFVECDIIAVGRIERDVCSTDMRRDEIGIAKATLNDLDAQVADGLNMRGVPHERCDLELRVGLDKLSKHGT